MRIRRTRRAFAAPHPTARAAAPVLLTAALLIPSAHRHPAEPATAPTAPPPAAHAHPRPPPPHPTTPSATPAGAADGRSPAHTAPDGPHVMRLLPLGAGLTLLGLGLAFLALRLRRG